MNEYEKRAKKILRYMDWSLAKRYCKAKIVHWTEKEFEFVRAKNESKEYWEIVLSYVA